MTADELIREADEYSRRVGSVGDPLMRPAHEAIAKIAFLAGSQAGIRFIENERKESEKAHD